MNEEKNKIDIEKICVILQMLIAIVMVIIILSSNSLGIEQSTLTFIEIGAFVIIMLLNIPFIK